jgi:hypothetical protein
MTKGRLFSFLARATNYPKNKEDKTVDVNLVGDDDNVCKQK